VEVFTSQEVWILILGAEMGANGEIIFHLLYDGLRERDQSIFSELGFFDVESPLLCSIVVLEQMKGFGDSHAASGHQQDGHIESELLEKGGLAPVHFFADGLEEVIGLLWREDERNRNLFLERGDIEQGVVLKDPSSYEETKEAPCGNEHTVHGGGLHGEIGSHVEKKGGAKGVPIGFCLMHIAVKNTKVVITGP
jgi:hypothetical protein